MLSWLRRCERIGKFPAQNPLGARVGFRTQSHYEFPGKLYTFQHK